MDGFFYPGPVDRGVRRKSEYGQPMGMHSDQFGISWMDNNVSEWMQESYRKNYLPMYTMHHQMLENSSNPGEKLLAGLEEYYDSRNDANGRLVRGGNFYDEEYSLIQDKNLAGIMLKRFVSPDSSHCTIGFRYVVRIKKM
jgi:hypothetical protein